ncbi:MAG: hypothetical protein QXV81_05145 [Ignisphaera sp.]
MSITPLSKNAESSKVSVDAPASDITNFFSAAAGLNVTLGCMPIVTTT